MQDQPILSILHISDFHFTKRHLQDQLIVVDALEADIRALCIGHRRPDIVIFSGDLVQAGGSDRHDEAYDFLISRIEATLT
jgi:3',5'-cyclic AMP phosphodiesterase CpdA